MALLYRGGTQAQGSPSRAHCPESMPLCPSLPGVYPRQRTRPPSIIWGHHPVTRWESERNTVWEVRIQRPQDPLHPCGSKPILGAPPGVLEVRLKEEGPWQEAQRHPKAPGALQFCHGETRPQAPRAPPNPVMGTDAQACGEGPAGPPLLGPGVLGEGRGFA